jgi:hypothetical protein
MTKYLVLRLSKAATDAWVPLGVVEASSAKAAIRSYLDASKDGSGEFVAVPDRSWQPVKVQVETALKFS